MQKEIADQTNKTSDYRFSFWPVAIVAGILLILLCVISPPDSSAQYFGQNKVTLKQHQWRILESPHFELHFYEEEREVAREAILYAERAYARLSQMFKHDMQNPIPLLIYASHTEFRESRAAPGLIGEGTGGLTEFLKRRVIVPFTGSYAELDYVLTHELTHAFQLDILSNPGFSNTLGPIRWTPPLWVMEGLAEYMGTPGIGPRTHMWTRDAILEGTLLDARTLSMVGDIRVYRYGQSLVHHIAQNFGDEALGLWFRSMSRSHSLETGTVESIGLTVDKLSEEWADSLRARHLPEIINHSKASNVARRLVDHRESLASFFINPSISPNGEKMVYISNETLYTDLYEASAIDGSHGDRLIRGQRNEDFETLRFLASSIHWHPDGELIVMITRRGGREVIVEFDTVTKTIVSQFDFDLDEMLSPVWSPDGSQLTFVGLKNGRSNLYLTDPTGSSLRALTDDRWSSFQPAWSPDGTRIAFMTDRDFNSYHAVSEYSPWKIAMVDVQTGDVGMMPDQPGLNTNPQWFPDGRHLLYISARSGISNLFVRDMETGKDFQLTDLLRGISSMTMHGPSMSLSADGHRLVMSVFENGGWNLFSIQDPLDLLATSTPWQPLASAKPGVSDEKHSQLFSFSPPAIPLLLEPKPDLALESPGDPIRCEYEGTLESIISTGLIAGVRSTASDSTTTPADEQSQTQVADQSAPADQDSSSPWEEIPPPPGTDHKLTTRINDLLIDKSKTPTIDIHDLYEDTSRLPDSIRCLEKPYKPSLTADLAQAGGMYSSGFGLQAQSVIVFSDLLGQKNLQIAADVNGSIEEGNYLLSYTDWRHNPAINIAFYQYWTGYGYSLLPGYVEQFERSLIRGLGFSLIKPVSRYRRFEYGLDLIQEKRYTYNNPHLDPWNPWQYTWDVEHDNRYYVRPQISWVFDSAIYGMTGPLSGQRTRLTGFGTFGGHSVAGGQIDHRIYLNYRQRYALAWRIVYAGEWGQDRRSYIIGGPYSMRGFTDHPLRGPNTLFSNLEFRFPFIDGFLVAWPLRLFFGGIRGAIFCDMGGAWDDPSEFRATTSNGNGHDHVLDDIKASFGFRTSVNLGFIILRWDLARRSLLTRWDGPAKGEVSVGVEF